jgi:predicted HNH restriction endonuclease
MRRVSIEHKRKKWVEKVVRWRQNTKRKLVEYKGGKCEVCGYNKCIQSLVFHHRDPSEKEFGITGKTRAFAKMKLEVDKCFLLCANCHGEIHAGVTTI